MIAPELLIVFWKVKTIGTGARLSCVISDVRRVHCPSSAYAETLTMKKSENIS